MHDNCHRSERWSTLSLLLSTCILETCATDMLRNRTPARLDELFVAITHAEPALLASYSQTHYSARKRVQAWCQKRGRSQNTVAILIRYMRLAGCLHAAGKCSMPGKVLTRSCAQLLQMLVD